MEVDGYDYETGEILVHTLFRFKEEAEDADGRVIGRLVREGALRSVQKLEMAGLSCP